MRIFISSSWKNEHAVVMLTSVLRERGHTVLSFVENNYGEGRHGEKPSSFEDWMKTPLANNSFKYDTDGATKSDLVIYIGPSGVDAWAEVGAAWASKVQILGLWAKGEQIGLMRKMVRWCYNIDDLIREVDRMQAAHDN